MRRRQNNLMTRLPSFDAHPRSLNNATHCLLAGAGADHGRRQQEGLQRQPRAGLLARQRRGHQGGRDRVSDERVPALYCGPLRVCMSCELSEWCWLARRNIWNGSSLSFRD